MRVEQGNLYKFMSLTDIYKIQWGSITLVSSVSPLTYAGLDAYAADMISQFKARLGGIVPDHDGGRPIEVNACILITHMVYL